MRIAIEGAPGVGKSTLCRDLVGLVERSTWVKEPVEENAYLADYYINPSRWALGMQVDILMRRVSAILAASSRRHPVEFHDRSVWGDRIFARTARDLGIMEPREFDTYDTVFRSVTGTNGVLPDVVVYLQADPDVIWSRVQSRARPEEAAMTKPYLEAVCKSYDAVFGLEGSPPTGTRVVLVDWNSFGDADRVWGAVELSYRNWSR
jgi:deoxyadenosine/deoxycytidine kinase